MSKRPQVAVKEHLRRKRAVESAYRSGYMGGHAGRVRNSAVAQAAAVLGVPKMTMYSWYRAEEAKRDRGVENYFPDDTKKKEAKNPVAKDHPDAIEHLPPASWTKGAVFELVSNRDNTFVFGAAGDLHAASKYCRWDVREALYKYFVEEGAQCNFDTGNWIDGEASFNRYDLEVHGMDRQIEHLAKHHPAGLPTYAVWGDDHEGWYAQREGVNVGKYAERVMREAGHPWVDLGFMEAHVLLRNANSGKAVPMSVVHPGGGSAYALSYAIQKIVESLEGGEKPAVGLYGHYHKLWSGLIRNVWCAQTGTQQDQTPFMRKKRLEAHVGGTLIKLRQNPYDGSITSMQCELVRYFNQQYYTSRLSRWSKHGRVRQLPRSRHVGRR